MAFPAGFRDTEAAAVRACSKVWLHQERARSKCSGVRGAMQNCQQHLQLAASFEHSRCVRTPSELEMPASHIRYEKYS